LKATGSKLDGTKWPSNTGVEHNHWSAPYPLPQQYLQSGLFKVRQTAFDESECKKVDSRADNPLQVALMEEWHPKALAVVNDKFEGEEAFKTAFKGAFTKAFSQGWLKICSDGESVAKLESIEFCGFKETQ
jgi:hypothetical protein